MGFKVCNRCLIQNTLLEFSPAMTCKDGYRNYCKECQSLKKKEWYENNKEHVLTKTALWQQLHPEIVKQTKQSWKNAHPEYAKEYKKEYSKKNKDKINAQTAARRKRVQRNTPIWANKSEIISFYLNCPKGHHVDHIIPLKGKNVSGLHVLENLQYLPAYENMKKGNKEMTKFLS